ncbi:hypothetical protein V2G26_009569 [Clonostachys chloroleuca]
MREPSVILAEDVLESLSDDYDARHATQPFGYSGREMCLDLYKAVLGRRCTEAIPSSSSAITITLSRIFDFKMKFAAIFLSVISVAAAAAVAPAIEARQSIETTTDEILFSITLPAFTARRNALDPNTVDWTSDGCTSSPDNPLGFPFTPACNRHDFGYNNYRAQTRLTVSTKKKIDDNFKKDLYYQCSSVSLRWLCEALADVYYAFVRVFAGGGDVAPGKRDDELVQIYEEKLAVYNQLLEEAKANGIIEGY